MFLAHLHMTALPKLLPHSNVYAVPQNLVSQVVLLSRRKKNQQKALPSILSSRCLKCNFSYASQLLESVVKSNLS